MLDAARYGLVQVVNFLYSPSCPLFYENSVFLNFVINALAGREHNAFCRKRRKYRHGKLPNRKLSRT